MAKYTLELREILKDKQIFNSINYDLYNNDYKPIFEDKFIKRFYFREIGTETIGRFLIYLETTLNEIMPYYTHLYATTTYVYNPILNYDVSETIIKEIVGESEGSNNSTQNGSVDDDTRHFDTPIIKTNNKDYYKSSPSFITNSNNTNKFEGVNNRKENNKSNENLTRSTKGNIGVMTTQDLIKKERDIIINIDKMILDELEVLFMQIF